MNVQKHPQWDDVLFENRNKAYGAYDLRKNEAFNLMKSLFAGIFFIGIALATLSFTAKNETKTDVPPPAPTIVDLSDLRDQPSKPNKPATIPKAASAPITPDDDRTPEPTDKPEIEKTMKDNVDLGKMVVLDGNKGDDNGSIIPAGTIGSDSGTDEPGDGENTATNSNTVFYARDVAYMAVFPGCEKFSKDKFKSQDCMAKKLQGELGIQLDDFREIANTNNIGQATAKLQFVVDKSGKIAQVRTMNGGNAKLSQEAQKAMERISEKFIQKGKFIRPAKLDDGTPVNMVFTIPVKFIPD